MHIIKWAALAYEDLDGIFAYIAEDNPERAASFILEILEEIDKLREYPLLGTKMRVARTGHYRTLHYKNFSVVYEVENQQILIHEIARHAMDNRRIRPLK